MDPGHPMEDVRASTTTTLLPPLQTAPHKSLRRHELAALMEWRKAHLENNRLCRLQDVQHSPGLGNTEKTGEGSTTSMPVLPLQDELCGSPKRRIPVSELVDLKKRMVAYHEEECLQKLQEEQEMQDTLANAERNAKTTGEGSTQTVQDSMEAGAPLVTVMVPPLQASDSSQQLGLSDDNLTELEVALSNPNLCPEDWQFTKSAKFKNVKKMVPGNAMTAR